MNILLLGSGGREHALAWKLLQSRHLTRLFVAPGSDAIARLATCVPLDILDFRAIQRLILRESIELVIVGPEAPLVSGLVDFLQSQPVKVFGPSSKAAQLEGSKVYTKKLLDRKKVPTASFGCFETIEEAEKFLKNQSYPLVVKADGLAAGKGVLICQNESEAKNAIHEILDEKKFGNQSQLVIESFLEGQEVSFMAICDGKHFLPLATSQDHKRVFDKDQGPNTGGMGAYSPAPIFTPSLEKEVLEKMLYPTLSGLNDEGVDFRGVLYAGLMIRPNSQPFLLEYNVRFGDPECQVLMMRLKSDLVELMLAAIAGRLASFKVEWDPRFAVCIVLSAKGYPGNYHKGDLIFGIDEAEKLADVEVFHAGTKFEKNAWVSSGGRVLGVTALGETLQNAIDRAYLAVSKISWDGMHYRKDIGKKGL